MNRLKMIRQWQQTRQLSTNAARSPSIYTFGKLVNSGRPVEEQERHFQQLYQSMGVPLFMQNLTIAISNTENKNNLNHLLEFAYSKFDELVTTSNFPFTIANDTTDPIRKCDNMLGVIFQLSIEFNLPIIGYTALINIINKALHKEEYTNEQMMKLFDSLLNVQNITMLIDLLSINKSQKTNIKEIDCIVTLISRYNQLVDQLAFGSLYELTDSQIKTIIDKASFCLIEDDTVTPYATIELLIRELGFFISKRVSYSISYYSKEVQDKKQEEKETENNVYNARELLDRQILSKYLQFCYLIIQERSKNNDPVVVYNIWSIIKPFHNKLYNATIDSENNNLTNNFYYYQTLSKIITVFSKNRRYRKLINEIIFDLPLDSVKICPELMTSILYHCGRTKNETLGSIVGSRYDDIDSPMDATNAEDSRLKKLFGQGGDLDILGTGSKFTPGQVHAFLSYNLRIGNKKRALEIAEYLKHELIGFTDIDFNEFIRSVLYSSDQMKIKENEEENTSNGDIAWSMIYDNYTSNKNDLNKFALITYLDYLVNTIGKNENKLDMYRVNEIFQFASSFKGDKYWNHFYMCYFKYLNRKFPLEVTKTVYENNLARKKQNGEFFQKLADYKFTTNPFLTRFEDVRFPINDNLRCLILRDVYQRSDGYLKRAKEFKSADLNEAYEQFQDISKWVYNEIMEIQGRVNSKKHTKSIIHNSIVIDLAKTIDKKARELGFYVYKEEEGGNMSNDERKYRIQMGEEVAIGDITVEDDYERSLAASRERWQYVFQKKEKK